MANEQRNSRGGGSRESPFLTKHIYETFASLEFFCGSPTGQRRAVFCAVRLASAGDSRGAPLLWTSYIG